MRVMRAWLEGLSLLAAWPAWTMPGRDCRYRAGVVVPAGLSWSLREGRTRPAA
jgi:hypothetical protein